jgi:dihydroorotate dehydrogenase electron transfer subunit
VSGDESLPPSAYYADHAWHGSVKIDENVRMARDTYRVRFGCREIAQRIVPGQFVMLRLAGYDDPLLGRPLALYDTVLDGAGTPAEIDLVYLVAGKMTSKLVRYLPGQQLEVWGPLGNGFPPEDGEPSAHGAEHLVLVAGGIGQTPFLALAQEALGRRAYGGPARRAPRAAKITFCYGVRSRVYFAGVGDFERLGIMVRTSTDDGTAGHHGLVTDLLRQTLTESDLPCRVVCCGPEPMMAAVADISRRAGVPCLVSLETPMACGIGICFSCVAKVRRGASWDYRRTCVEGPVFDASAVLFEDGK